MMMTREEAERSHQGASTDRHGTSEKKHPALTASRFFFFGLLEVRMWGYYWGYTSAQIELMAADCPVIVYPKRKDEKNGKSTGFKKADAKDVSEAARHWQKKYGGKSDKGVKISLAGLKQLKK